MPLVGEEQFEQWAEALEGTGSYRVLRRIKPVTPRLREARDDEKVALIVDTETTGLNLREDEVIEFGALAFTYSVDGIFQDVIGSFSGFREPSILVPEDVTSLTGITNSMLRGKKLDTDAIDALVQQSDLIIAHNASFDRPFCERISKVFKDKPWACSATEINWRRLGFDGAKLTYLVNHAGWYYEAHRALDDCNALRVILAQSLPGSTETPLNHLLQSARAPRTRIKFWAPFGLRSRLRSRGYRWMPAEGGRAGFWFMEVEDANKELELAFLRTLQEISYDEIFLSRVTAYERYQLPND